LNLSHPLMITAAAGRNWMKSVIPGWKCTIEIPTTNSGITAANNFISHKYS
jgi:hypothetical protein